MVECSRLPLVAVIVSVYVPAGVLRFVATVSDDVAGKGGFSDVGLKVQVLRGGQPATLRLTVPAKPFKDVTVVVYLAEEPRAIV